MIRLQVNQKPHHTPIPTTTKSSQKYSDHCVKYSNVVSVLTPVELKFEYCRLSHNKEILTMFLFTQKGNLCSMDNFPKKNLKYNYVDLVYYYV